MRFFYSKQGIPDIQTRGSSVISLPSTEKFRDQTIPFSHIFFSSETYFQQLSESLSIQDRDDLVMLPASAQQSIAKHSQCPRKLTSLNIKSVSAWHASFANKETVHILLVGGFGESAEHLDQGFRYLQRLTQLLAPVKLHFHLTQCNDATLKSVNNKASNVHIYPDCVPANIFLKADFYVDLNPVKNQPIRTKLLPLFEQLERTSNALEQQKIAVIIPHFGSQKKLNRCLDALIKVQGFDPRWLYIVDNNVNNRYFTIGVNVGLELAIQDNCDFFWILNNDTQPHSDYISASLKRFNANPKAGLVGGKNLVTDRPDRIFWGGSHNAFPTGTHKAGYVSKNNLNIATQESWATFSSVIIRGATLKECGLLDANMRMIFSDSDYCFHIGKQGWQIWYEPTAVVLHDTGVSRSTPNKELKNIFRKDKINFYRKWSKITDCEEPEKLQEAIFKKLSINTA